MQKKLGQIFLYLEIFNFKTFKAKILQIFELLIWKIDELIHSFWLYLTFSFSNLPCFNCPEWPVLVCISGSAWQCNATLSNLLFLTQRKPDSAWWSMHQRSKETKLARRRLIQGRTFSDFQFLAKKFYTETPIRLSNCKTVGRSLNFWGKVVNKEDYLLKPIWAKKLRWEGLEGSIHWHCSGLLQVSRKHAYRF